MTVTVVIPTVDGREESVHRAIRSCGNHRTIIVQNRPTCGAAWVEGARRAVTEHVAFFADDLEAQPGYWDAMIEAADKNMHPAGLVVLPDGSVQSCGGAGADVCRLGCEDWHPVEWSPTPFIRREWWPLIEPHAAMLARLHYSTDCLVSAILAKHDIPSVMRREAVVTHHNHDAGRLNTAGADAWAFYEYRREHAL